MTFLAATAYENWPVIKQLAWLLGYVMRGIFWVLSNIGIVNIGACIIVFTIITRMCMYPLTVKQQKLMKLNAVVMPEVQTLQKKYAGKNRDQQAMLRMQAEQQAIYDKYGYSMTGGCLPSLIQFPILFALYPVIYSMEKYVPEISNYDSTVLYNFFGINLQEAPGLRLTPAILIPILAGLSQFFSAKLMMAKHSQPTSNDSDNPMANSMKMMNYTMPIMSVVFTISLPAFLGVYWIMQSVVMIIQQLIVNKHLSRYSVEDIIKQNIAKKNKKRAKKGLPPLNEKATVNARKIQQNNAGRNVNREQRDAKIQESTEYYRSKSGGSGSLAAKANMVREYNEKHKK